jgi:hypothetical protein
MIKIGFTFNVKKPTPPNTVREMGLHYASDHQLGIRRETYRQGFRYRLRMGGWFAIKQFYGGSNL